MSGEFSGVAVVTGASSGIGRATAEELARRGMSVCVTGRDAARLQDCARSLGKAASLVHVMDLTAGAEIARFAQRVRGELGRLDVLVHSAGALRLGNLEQAEAKDFDELYQVNLRAPFLLTKACFPLLVQSEGQVAFVNSSAALAAGVDNALYAATKAALRSLAGSLRDYANPLGVRVLSLFAGRTATPMQEAVYRFEGRSYQPQWLLQPSDVARAIADALALPRSAEATDIMIRSMKKPPVGRSSG
jgi:NADP-dependent 3-hydroxy acid dehydrogenase YdfG